MNPFLQEIERSGQFVLPSGESVKVHSNVGPGAGVLQRAIEVAKPWAMAKDPEQAEGIPLVLFELLEKIDVALQLLTPALPHTVQKAQACLFAEGALVAGTALSTEAPMLFPRLA